MTTARTELPYPCSPHAKTRDESSRRGKSVIFFSILGTVPVPVQLGKIA